jgi:hypothetical protein
MICPRANGARFQDVSKTLVESRGTLSTDAELERPSKEHGYEQIGGKNEQHHQLGKSPIVKFESLRRNYEAAEITADREAGPGDSVWPPSPSGRSSKWMAPPRWAGLRCM